MNNKQSAWIATVRRAAPIILTASAAGCGGGGDSGAPAPSPAPPPVFQDGLGVSGVSPSATMVFDSGQETYHITPGLAIAGNGTVVVAWGAVNAGALSTRGQGADWTALQQIAPGFANDLRLSGNDAGEVAAKWGSRLFRSTTTSSWQPAATDGDAYIHERETLTLLADGTTVYTRRNPNQTGSSETQLVQLPRTGGVQRQIFPDYLWSSVVAAPTSVRGLLHGHPGPAPTNRFTVNWRTLKSDLSTDSVVTIADAPSYCVMGPFGYQRGPLYSAIAESRNGIAAATLSRGGYGDAGSSYSQCELIAATIHPDGSAVAEKLTSTDGYLNHIPVVAAGGNLALIIWKEAVADGVAGRSGWFAASSVTAGPFSAAVPFGPLGLTVDGPPALVIDNSGQATAAVMVSRPSGPSLPLPLQRIYVANYSEASGWTNWRAVFAGYSAFHPALAINGAGQIALAFSGAPCDRTTGATQPICTVPKTAGMFVMRNP